MNELSKQEQKNLYKRKKEITAAQIGKSKSFGVKRVINHECHGSATKNELNK